MLKLRSEFVTNKVDQIPKECYNQFEIKQNYCNKTTNLF